MFKNISTQAKSLVSLASKKTRNSKTKVVSVTSGKGGVGKSTITANLAYLFSKQNFKIAILDADIGLANMQVLLNVKPQYTFFDYLDKNIPLEKILTQTQYKNITLIAGKSGYEYIQNDTSSLVFTRIVEEILELNKFDILLIDTGAGLNEYVQEFLNISDEILAVTTTDPSAITDVYALMKMLSKTQEKLLICFNHTKKYSIGRNITNSLKDLAQKNRLNKNFMVKYIGSINGKQNVQVTGRLRKLFVQEFEHDEVTQDLDRIAHYVLMEL
jgi:flagellar biosynthesis protein FlhG